MKNASFKVDPWSDDLSGMLEPPTGRMVEPEEEVDALFFYFVFFYPGLFVLQVTGYKLL